MNEFDTTKLSIIVPACDEYLDVLREFIRYFEIFWSDCPFKVIIVTQNVLIEGNDFIGLTTNDNAKWLDRVIAGLQMTDSKFILTMMEDAFLFKKVDNRIIFQILAFMENNNIVYYRNPKKPSKICQPSFNEYSFAKKIRKDIPYNVSCFTTVWDRNKLVELYENQLKTAWDIENYYLHLSSVSSHGYFIDYASDCRNFLNVIEVINQGRWTRDVECFQKALMPINLGNRAKAPISIYIRKKIHAFFRHIIPNKSRASVKRILSLVGYRFVTKD